MSDDQAAAAIRQYIEADMPPPDPAHLLGGSKWLPKPFQIAVMGEGGVGKHNIVRCWQLWGFNPNFHVDPTDEYWAHFSIDLHGVALKLEVDIHPPEVETPCSWFLKQDDVCVYVYAVTRIVPWTFYEDGAIRRLRTQTVLSWETSVIRTESCGSFPPRWERSLVLALAQPTV